MTRSSKSVSICLTIFAVTLIVYCSHAVEARNLQDTSDFEAIDTIKHERTARNVLDGVVTKVLDSLKNLGNGEQFDFGKIFNKGPGTDKGKGKGKGKGRGKGKGKGKGKDEDKGDEVAPSDKN